MSSDCQECQQNLKMHRSRVKINQMTQEEKATFFDNLKKLYEISEEIPVKTQLDSQG